LFHPLMASLIGKMEQQLEPSDLSDLKRGKPRTGRHATF